MKKRETYNTKQKEKIINIIINKHNTFTIKDLYNELNKEIGLTTIYRFADKLVEEGYLSKTIDKDNITKYQYLEKCTNHNHFYLKCEVCGIMEHVDCDCIEDLSSHILEKHKFSLKNNVIIQGLCANCVKGVNC